MKILTALANENINKKLEVKQNCEIIYKDIQYQEALLEILDKNKNIDVLILSSILPGELDIYELINLIKYKQENINIYIILDKQNDKLIKFSRDENALEEITSKLKFLRFSTRELNTLTFFNFSERAT